MPQENSSLTRAPSDQVSLLILRPLDIFRSQRNASGIEKKIVRRLSIKLFQVRGKNEIWHEDALKNGEVKLVRSHTKVGVESFRGGGGALVFAPCACLRKRKCQIFAFRIHEMSNTNEKTVEIEVN